MMNSATPSRNTGAAKRISSEADWPARRTRNPPIEPMATMPASTPTMRMLSPMSPFRMWLNSWPITACSSSRVSRSSVPRVTAITEPDVLHPAAKALMPRSWSITYACGSRTPDAIAISSTMLRKRRSSASLLAGATARAPSRRATCAPPSARAMMLTMLTTAMIATVTAAPAA